MFYLLLFVTFLIAAITSFFVERFFKKPIGSILDKIIKDEIHLAWKKYMQFAIYVVGISGGIKIWEIEKYLRTNEEGFKVPILNNERWTLEVFRTLIETLQSLAWMLLLFFMFSLIAYIFVRFFESKINIGK